MLAMIVFIAAAVTFPAAAPGLLEVQQAAGGARPGLVLPARRAPDAAPAEPPALPTAAARIPPLTIAMSIVRPSASGSAIAQTVSRTPDRIHVSAVNGREWLFEQDGGDPRRAAGFMIDHASRTIVLYAESDLRMLAGLRGWLDVLLLGFDLEALGRCTLTRDRQTIGAARFTRCAPTEAVTPSPDVWWSEDHLLAREIVSVDRTVPTRSRIVGVRSGVDRSLLEPASARFPAYRGVPAADWLEHR